MNLWQAIAADISATTGQPFHIASRRALGGGCINAVLVVEGDGQRWFVKTNEAAKLAMFKAESEGLRELAGAGTIRVPQPLCHGVAEGTAYLVMEHIEFGQGGEKIARRLGEQLAALHRVTAPTFGWRRDNVIGATHQENTPATEWIEFWRTRRLGFQLDLAARHGASASLLRGGEKLLDALPALFADYQPLPALLHGDLWGGNYAADVHGKPVIFDPAVYYGDREADLAMTELFGGFPPGFYAAYQAAWPLAPGYQTRKTLYNLYHVLNHFNLFGGGYAHQAQRMIAGLLAELR
ncbi:MAG: fructosamine kinase family protein [Sulfuricella sp.]|nr:fructosamine kinase family protein [Sulfuricella sp.]